MKLKSLERVLYSLLWVWTLLAVFITFYGPGIKLWLGGQKISLSSSQKFAFWGLPIYLLWKIKRKEKFPFHHPLLDFSILAYLGVSGLSSLWSLAPQRSLSTFFELLGSFIFFYILLGILKTEKDLKRVLFAFLLGCAGTYIYGFLQWGSILPRGGGWAITGGWGTKNRLGMFLQLNILFFLGLSLGEEKKEKGFFLTLFILGFFLLLLTQSRGAWLAAGSSFLLFALLTQKRTLLLSLFFLYMGVSLLALEIPGVFPYFRKFFDPFHFTNIERIFIIKSAFKIIQENFWLGIGIGKKPFQIAYSEHIVPGASGKIWPHAHNLFLQQWVSTGIFGFLSLLFLLYFLFRCLLKNLPSLKKYKFAVYGIISGLAGNIFIQGMVGYPWRSSRGTFTLTWFFVALALSLSKLKRSKNEKN